MIQRRTKIIATMSSKSNKDLVVDFMDAGMDIIRLNMSHEHDHNKIRRFVKMVRQVSSDLSRPLAILFDLCGPKIRTTADCKKIKIIKGKAYSLGVNSDIPINQKIKFDDTNIKKNAKVKIDDGKIIFSVKKVINNQKIEIIAENDGLVGPSKGINIPRLDINISTVQEKDILDVKLALDLDIDWLALSFVRSSKDRIKIDQIYKKESKTIPVIAKIEKPEAVKNIKSIIRVFNGILIARGDLGIEVPIEQVPIIQKKIIRLCNQLCKPVITATQMLESMIKNPIPTRAEVSDVASAVYDGIDSMMLTAETVVGSYKKEAIAMMNSIIKNSEKEIATDEGFQSHITIPKEISAQSSVCHSAYMISEELNIEIIVIMTETGKTANVISSYRPNSLIIAMTPRISTYYKLVLTWGVTPVLVNQFSTTDEMLIFAKNYLVDKKLIKTNDSFIMTAGVPVGVTGTTNMIKIEKF